MTGEELKSLLKEAGACTCGFAALRPVADEVFGSYLRWIEAGGNASMEYLARNLEIRRNPALLLDRGRNPLPGGTIISAAFPYFSGKPWQTGCVKFARYALGDDYHEVLRNRLRPVAASITDATGAEARICVDTAPILERYWAVEAGVGFIGRNHQVIVGEAGAWVFLAEIVTRAVFPPDAPSQSACPPGCDACVRACPGSMVKAGECRSYLTIEHRGPLPESLRLTGGRIYGCDLCLEACPLCHDATAQPLPEFMPRQPLLSLTKEDIERLTPETYTALLRHSPVKRAKLEGLLRNARQI